VWRLDFVMLLWRRRGGIPLHMRLLGEGFFGAAYVALAEGTGFNRKRIVNNVAVDMGAGEDLNANAAYRTNYAPANHHIFAGNFSVHRALRANDNRRRANITLNGAFNLQFATGDDIALNDNIRADNGWRQAGATSAF
jgi:hypothetical protein